MKEAEVVNTEETTEEALRRVSEELERLRLWFVVSLPGVDMSEGPVEASIRTLETVKQLWVSVTPILISVVSQAITAANLAGLVIDEELASIKNAGSKNMGAPPADRSSREYIGGWE